MKKFLALILSLAMVFALVACGGEKTDDNQNNDGDTSSPVSITLATGGTSGTYYAVGGVLKTVLGDKLTLSTLNVESTGASVANVNMITDGEAQMAILQSDVINYAHEGTNSFDGAPETDALWVAGIYNETVQILAKPASTPLPTSRARPSALVTLVPVPRSTPGRCSALRVLPRTTSMR